MPRKPAKPGTKREPSKPKHWAKFHFYIIKKGIRKPTYYWRIRSCNGEKICHSEIYTAAAGPEKTITNLIKAIRQKRIKIIRPVDERI